MKTRYFVFEVFVHTLVITNFYKYCRNISKKFKSSTLNNELHHMTNNNSNGDNLRPDNLRQPN